MPTHQVTYQINNSITPKQFIALLKKCGLGAHRPVDNYYVIKGMLDNADLLITAWVNSENEENDKTLIGVARCVTDFSYCCYLSDWAVVESYQHQGIGKLMIKKIEQQLPPSCQIIALSVSEASDYYAQVGFIKHDNAWVKAAG